MSEQDHRRGYNGRLRTPLWAPPPFVYSEHGRRAYYRYTETSPPFRYMPLFDPSKQIRLLSRRQPNIFRKVATLWDLTVHALDQVEDCYEAISYTWGEPSPTLPIMVNDRPVEITRKVWDILELITRKEKYHTRGRQYWWIDTLCIDQSNAEEKSQQVKLMGKIYARAKQVSIHFDPDLTARGKNTKDLYDIPHLVRDPYFERMWIVQEFLMGKRRIMLGKYDVFEDLDEICQEERGRALPMQKGLGTPFDDLGQREAPGQFKPLLLIDLLRKYSGGKCADPRDQVYSLLSLACNPDGSEISFPVDYNRSDLEVFEDLVKYIDAWYPATEDRAQTSDVVSKVAASMGFDAQQADKAIRLMSGLLVSVKRNGQGDLVTGVGRPALE